MPPDIINAPALQDAIDEFLEGAPLALQGHLPALRVGLRRGLESHESVRKARRRKNDPDWAQRKFAEGHTLHRFFRGDMSNWEITDLLKYLSQVAGIAASGGALAAEAAAFLRGLAHSKEGIDDIGASARALLERAETAALRARRHEALRQPVNVAAGSMVGMKCVSIDDITRLGREARNCLADNEEHWKSFASGQTDIWSLRDSGHLVAVLEVLQDGRVTEVFGPRNASIELAAVGQVAAFCQTAGLELEGTWLNVLPGFAEAPLIAPRTVRLKSRIALYAEWPTAVRIDLSSKSGGRRSLWDSDGPERTLTLSFDPRRSCSELILSSADPRTEVKRFGRKHLRRILKTVALDQAVPTLVQHRLLALVA
jgi:hypothetical protein